MQSTEVMLTFRCGDSVPDLSKMAPPLTLYNWSVLKGSGRLGAGPLVSYASRVTSNTEIKQTTQRKLKSHLLLIWYFSRMVDNLSEINGQIRVLLVQMGMLLY